MAQRPAGVGRPHTSLEEIEDSVIEGDRPLRTGTARSALRHRTFRIIFFGAFASNIGTWMQNVVLGAYGYDLTHSSTFVGLIVFAQLGPSFLLSMLGGLVADRVNRKRFLVALAIEQTVFSFLLAWVAVNRNPSHLVLILTVVMVGVGSALYAPTYSAIIPSLVGTEDLPGAISLNSAQLNGSRVIGPAIGGLAFHFVGPAWVFAGNAVTYLFVVLALLVVTLPATNRARASSTRWRELTAGVALARHDRIVGRCLVTVFVFSLLSLAFLGQLPVIASESLHIDPKSASYGILYACFGTGALLGALSIGTVFARRSKAQIVKVCLVGYALALALFAELRWAAPAYAVILVVGMFYFAFITSLNTVLQTELDDAVRGRVMALWIMGFGGTVAVGNLIAGPIVGAIGVTSVLLFGAGVALALVSVARVARPTPAAPILAPDAAQP